MIDLKKMEEKNEKLDYKWSSFSWIQSFEIVSNGRIWLIFGVRNQLTKRIAHTKYEPNRTIFNNFQNFGPFYFDDTEKWRPKFLICY